MSAYAAQVDESSGPEVSVKSSSDNNENNNNNNSDSSSSNPNASVSAYPTVHVAETPSINTAGSAYAADTKQQTNKTIDEHPSQIINNANANVSTLVGRLDYGTARYRDIIWALLFVAHFILIIAFLIKYYRTYNLEAVENRLTNTSSQTSTNLHYDQQANSDANLRLDGDTWDLLAILFFVNIGLGVIWFQLFKKFPGGVIKFALIFSCIMTLGMAIACFVLGGSGIIIGALLLVFLLFQGWWVKFVWSSIPFSAQLLKIISVVIQTYPGTTIVAICSIFVQILWFIVWILALVCIRWNLEQNGNTDADGFVFFALVISLYWTSEVITNVVHVTVSGSVASWYFIFNSPNGMNPTNLGMPANPTIAALKRALTTSFGSICVGSLVMAIIRTLRYMAQSLNRADHPMVKCIALCFLNCIESLCDFLNDYAYAYVAIYGRSYCDSARLTFQLLKGNGMRTVINDCLVSKAINLASFASGIGSGLVAGLTARYTFNITNPGLVAFIGFLLGFLITASILSVIHSGVLTLLVAYSESPEILYVTKPDTYEMLTEKLEHYTPFKPIFVPSNNPANDSKSSGSAYSANNSGNSTGKTISSGGAYASKNDEPPV